MLNQYFVATVLANEHQLKLLKEANTYRTARQAKKEQFLQASRLKRIVAFLSGKRIGAVRPVGDQASLFTDRIITAGHR